MKSSSKSSEIKSIAPIYGLSPALPLQIYNRFLRNLVEIISSLKTYMETHAYKYYYRLKKKFNYFN